MTPLLPPELPLRLLEAHSFAPNIPTEALRSRSLAAHRTARAFFAEMAGK